MRIRVFGVEKRSLTSSRACLQERRTGGEVGFGKLTSDGRLGQSAAPGLDRIAGEGGSVVKIEHVKANNHKRAFEVTLSKGNFPIPYSELDPVPSKNDPVVTVYADEDFGREAFTYLLKSGSEGSVHVDAVLEYNEDPAYMRDLLLYRLTVAAQECMKASPLSQREITRRARTSPAQVQRLLDVNNRSKSVDKLVVLLGAMDCEVEVTVRPTRPRSTGCGPKLSA